MKKLLFAIMALTIILSASSCKKCGYCLYASGLRSSDVCQVTGALGATEELTVGADDYIAAESNCMAQAGATWVVE
jgi:hypothetical protein